MGSSYSQNQQKIAFGTRQRCPNSRIKNAVSKVGAVGSMDYIEKVLEKLKEWARKLIETLLGPEAEPEPEPIPIPVNERSRRW